jgi:hypothetical protein
MAWPKLRNRKSTGPLMMVTERNGLARENAARDPDGAQQPPAPAAPAAGPAPAQPEEASPPSWPSAPLQSQRQNGEAPDAAGQQPAQADVPFWDWAPPDDAEDMRFSIDDEPDGGGAPGASTGMDAQPTVIPMQRQQPTAAEPAYEDEPEQRQEGVGRRLGNLNHIFGHSRMGAWRRRALIAIVIGVVVTVLLNWQVGLTLAVLAAIADTIYRSRVSTVKSMSGTKLTRAQRQTQAQLVKLERAGYKALHSRLIPASEDHIDHLVIGPAGVFAIDSESWDKHLPIRTKNARQLWHGPFSMKDRLEHARWESEQAADLLSKAAGQKVSVRPAMAVYGPKIPWDVATIRDVDVFSGGRLRVYLRRYSRHNPNPPLSPTEIDKIYRAAHIALPHLDPGVLAPQPFAQASGS